MNTVALPFQLSELFILDENRQAFHCRYFVLRRSMDDVPRHGPGHGDDSLNAIDTSDTAAWKTLRTVFEALVYPIPDVWLENQFDYSVYAEGLRDPNTNFRRLQEKYSELVKDTNLIRPIPGVKDLTVVRVPDADGGVAGVVRLFNQIKRPGSSLDQTSLGYVQLLYGRWIEVFLAEATPAFDELGSVTLPSGPVTIRSRHASMKGAFRIARAAANNVSPILIEGPTGTGKEGFARWIHENSSRKNRPLVIISAAELDDLAESRLFGHEAGSFTGARKRTDGLFHHAHGSSLFIDEVGKMPTPLQAKLLRAVEYKEIRRLGAGESETVDVRIITAANEDLEKMVAAGKFGEDLWNRLNGFRIVLPPLRDRRDDIPDLIDAIVAQLGPRPIFPTEVKRLLAERPWPGNIRQLVNTIRMIAGLHSEYDVVPMSAILDVPGGYDVSDVRAAMLRVLAIAREVVVQQNFAEQFPNKGVLDVVCWMAVETTAELEGDLTKTMRALGGVSWNTAKEYRNNYQKFITPLKEVRRE